jgi:Leucine-rich repeat (LRR) protein
LDCSNNKRVDISFTKINRLKEINLDGCESLVELDAGENGLEEIQLENLP